MSSNPSFTKAFQMMFCSYDLHSIDYPVELAATLEFLQSFNASICITHCFKKGQSLRPPYLWRAPLTIAMSAVSFIEKNNNNKLQCIHMDNFHPLAEYHLFLQKYFPPSTKLLLRHHLWFWFISFSFVFRKFSFDLKSWQFDIRRYVFLTMDYTTTTAKTAAAMLTTSQPSMPKYHCSCFFK